jgi:uncharacterized membrane protein
MDNSIMIQLSAFSGLLGALLTQALTGTFQYFSDRRKVHNELRGTFRNKQVEIAENFYYVTGEKMAVIRKNIDYWRNCNTSRSNDSISFLNREMKKMNTYMEKLDAENWKCNLVGLYFSISLTNDKIIKSNDKSKELFLRVLDLADTFKHSLEESKHDVFKIYCDAVNEMCTHYETVCSTMAADMATVKVALNNELRS